MKCLTNRMPTKLLTNSTKCSAYSTTFASPKDNLKLKTAATNLNGYQKGSKNRVKGKGRFVLNITKVKLLTQKINTLSTHKFLENVFTKRRSYTISNICQKATTNVKRLGE